MTVYVLLFLQGCFSAIFSSSESYQYETITWNCSFYFHLAHVRVEFHL